LEAATNDLYQCFVASPLFVVGRRDLDMGVEGRVGEESVE
jgi:hypothetical protein